MHYLTVQDVLWLHLQIAKKAVKFNYAKLEEGVNYQYAYGKSKDILSQSARFFSGFPKMNPFESGNRAVTLAAGITFLALNGYELKVNAKDLSDWLDRASSPSDAKVALELAMVKSDHAHHGTTKEIAKDILEKYHTAISKLMD